MSRPHPSVSASADVLPNEYIERQTMRGSQFSNGCAAADAPPRTDAAAAILITIRIDCIQLQIWPMIAGQVHGPQRVGS